MVYRVSVGSSFRSPWCTVPYLVAVIVCVGACFYWWAVPKQRVPAALLWCAIGLSLTIAAIAVLITVRRRRMIDIREHDFRIIDHRGTHKYRDSDVESLAIQETQHYAAGCLRSVTRKTTLWLPTDWVSGSNSNSAFHPVTLTTRIPDGAPDPLAPFAERVSEVHFQRFRERLRFRESVAGDGWRLTCTELTWGTPPEEQSVSTSGLAAVEVIDDHICVWRAGDAKALARLPKDGRNALSLYRLLKEEVRINRDRVGSRGFPPVGEELGRILFERVSWRSSLTAKMVGGMFSLGGLGVVAAVITQSSTIMLILAVVIALLGTSTIIVGLACCRNRFCFHEYGISQVGLLSVSSLSFREMAALTYSEEHQSIQGFYLGTLMRLLLEPHENAEGNRIEFLAKVRNTDRAVAGARGQFATNIADRMQRRLEEEHVVEWTPRTRLRIDGVEIFPGRRLLGKRQATFIPYSAINLARIEGKDLCLWTNYQERSVLRVKTSERNFFPGFVLLKRMLPT